MLQGETGDFEALLKSTSREIRNHSGEVVVIGHDEADGICSAAIMKYALERGGKKVDYVCLDKLFPEVLESLHSAEGYLILYVDLGSAHAKKISKINRGRNLVVIVDHHDPETADDPQLVNVNPERFGFSGERDASASTVAYYLAEALSSENRVLSHLGVVGSAENPNGFLGLNKKPLQRAEEGRLVEIVRRGNAFDVKVLAFQGSPSYKRASTLLSVLGSVGYYRNGPLKAVQASLSGFPKGDQEVAAGYEEERRIANKKLLERIRETGLSQGKFAQWFHAEDAYAGMSGKVLGSFCSYLRFQRIVNPAKYLLGFMHISRTVPGFGELERDYTKASARAPEVLGKMISAGKRPPLSSLMAQACSSLDGFGDGHTVAASGIIPKGAEEDFIQTFDRMVEEKSGK